MEIADITGGWDHATLATNVHAGAGCFLERRETFDRVRGAVTLGERVAVYTWTAFDVRPAASVEVGDDCVLVGAQFMCADLIVLGRGVVLSFQTIVADSDFHPRDPAARRLDALANAPGGGHAAAAPLHTAPVVFEDGAWVGIGAIVLKGVRVGAGARVAPGAVVTTDVPAGATVAGNPAVVVAP